MTIKAVVTGAHGQLGQELIASAGAGFDCTALGREQLDIGDLSAVEQCIEALQPQVLINAAAYTAVDKAESEAAAADRVNRQGPSNLAQACAAHGVRLIHISTDFVFDGTGTAPYQPNDATSPLGEYGRSKLAGELAVQSALSQSLIIRTSWVYSAHGNNFVKTMLRLMAERDELGVVADQVGSPTWAQGLAQLCWVAAGNPQVNGVYHWCDDESCSWFEFAVAIQEEAIALGLLDKRAQMNAITTADYPTPAQRPVYSVLDSSATQRDFQFATTHWRQQLRNMLAQLKEQKNG